MLTHSRRLLTWVVPTVPTIWAAPSLVVHRCAVVPDPVVSMLLTNEGSLKETRPWGQQPSIRVKGYKQRHTQGTKGPATYHRRNMSPHEGSSPHCNNHDPRSMGSFPSL
jgi:hypothetical protein